MLLLFNKDDFKCRIFSQFGQYQRVEPTLHPLLLHVRQWPNLYHHYIYYPLLIFFCDIKVNESTVDHTVCAVYEFVVKPFVACFFFQYCLTYAGLMITLHFVGSYFL
jgi:hypothetical protein